MDKCNKLEHSTYWQITEYANNHNRSDKFIHYQNFLEIEIIHILQSTNLTTPTLKEYSANSVQH
jgi:hypothetical protein